MFDFLDFTDFIDIQLMRITHRRKKEEPKKTYLINEAILAPKVLVLDAEGANIGVMSTREAISKARETGMDLVEINPKINPPVAKIMNFGQFRYQLEKEARLAKAHQHIVDLKGVRLSLRIGQHDAEIRKNQAIKFLNQGDKVKIEMILRGRELQQVPMGIELVKKFIADLNAAEPTRFEQQVERQGNKITAIIAKA